MDLLRILTREEPIAGLEISDEYLRLAFLSFNKKTAKNEIKFLTEEPLDESGLVAALKKLIVKSPVKIKNLIVSIPANGIYSRLFSFPKTVSKIRIEEAMKLTVGFQLPAKPEDSYLDWEKLESQDKNEIILATVPKNIINAYLEAFSAANLNPIAVEFHSLSLARIIEAVVDKPLLIKLSSKDSVGIFIIKNNTVQFSRILPKSFIADKKNLDEELKRIADYFETENNQPAEFLEISDLKIFDALKADQLIKDNKWLISIGAAWRGLTPRSQDEFISLMPLGTEQAYEYQKAVSFSELVSDIIIGLSVFFAVAYLGTLLLMFSIQRSILKQMENLTAIPFAEDAVALEEKAKDLNGLIKTESEITKTLFRYSVILEELKSKVPPEIKIASIDIPSPDTLINIVGVAQNRAQLNLFKKSVESSEFFSEVRIPLTNIEQKDNISFSMALRVRDPQKIVYQPSAQ